MLTNSSSQQNVDKTLVVAAIAALKVKGVSINPYTVAEEAQVARSVIIRNKEFMDLVAQARGDSVGISNVTSDELMEKVDRIEEENQELQDTVATLKLANQILAKNIREAWQQGYRKGREQIQKAVLASLQIMPEKDTTADTKQLPKATSSLAKESAIQSQEAPESTDNKVVADNPGDIFTTKLYAALAADKVSVGVSAENVKADEITNPTLPKASLVSEMTAAHTVDYESPSFDQLSSEPAGEATVPENTEPYSSFTCEPDGLLEKHSNQPSNDMEDAIAETAEPLDRAFTEDELRELLKKKFVKPEDVIQSEVVELENTKSPAAPVHKFVGTNRPASEPSSTRLRVVPPGVRKALLMLGLRAEELTPETVSEAWKKEMAKPGVHPDYGGDTEIAVYLNTAKDTLLRWLDAQTPKLGKKFGASTKDQVKPSQNKNE